MNKRYWLYKRGRTYYLKDSETGKQESLRTKDKSEAQRLLDARNDSLKAPMLSMALARAYLVGHDQNMADRTWDVAMDQMLKVGVDATRNRNRRALIGKAFDVIRHKRIVETISEDFLAVIEAGPQSVSSFLKRLHNLALGLGWLPWPILHKNMWPNKTPKSKRGITWEAHGKIVEVEPNKELKQFYEILWETGASQTDAAFLSNENVDWSKKLIVYHRRKLGKRSINPPQVQIGARLEQILTELPVAGPFFPYLQTISESRRATFFFKRCRRLGISGITLHSYRYAWAERAQVAGYPERWAQAALGHNSKAVHRAYASGARVICPSLDEYEANPRNRLKSSQ